MISHLSGTVLGVYKNFIVLDVHGVGYKVHCTENTLDKTSTETNLSLHTHLAVRENAMDLFGFETQNELELFTMLIGISGIGPRSALGIIGLESSEKLVGAISEGDISYLTKVSGVGKKSAEKIVLELKDKVGLLDAKYTGTALTLRQEEEDVLEALKTLGYRADEARDALRQIPKETKEQGQIIKEALKILSGR